MRKYPYWSWYCPCGSAVVSHGADVERCPFCGCSRPPSPLTSSKATPPAGRDANQEREALDRAARRLLAANAELDGDYLDPDRRQAARESAREAVADLDALTQREVRE